MFVRVYITLVVCALPTIALAQQSNPSPLPKAEIKTGKVPDVLYAQFPTLKPGSGVVILEVPPKSIGRGIGFQQFDIIISCNGTIIKSDQQLERLLAENSDNESFPVVVLRSGKLHTFRVRTDHSKRTNDDSQKSVAKPGGPPPLRVTAEPLSEGRFKLNFQYYIGSGKLVRLEQTGTLGEIREQLRHLNAEDEMPVYIYDLASAVLQHIRQSTSVKRPAK